MQNALIIKVEDRQMKYALLFNQRAKEWLETLHTFTDEQIQKRPSKDSWSLGLLYDHIIKVAYTYQIVNAKIATSKESDKTGFKNPLGFLLMDSHFMPRLAIKMEKFPDDLVKKFTPAVQSKAELIAAFSEFIDEVNSQFDTLARSNSNATLKHPMFGYLNGIEWLRLVEIHMKHHERQKSKIKNAVKI